jgi:MFS family permease
MGSATFLVGFLPTFATIGWGAPILLVALRIIQGIAVGGEAGGAITYVAEHARAARRGFATSWLQTCGTLGLALALVVILLCREFIEAGAFAEWGWRVPFIVSAILLIFAIYIRLRLNETPMFIKMKEEGKRSRAPLTESFLRYPNNKYVLLALLPSAGQAVVWYTGQFYALFFLTITLKMNYLPAYLMVLVSLIIATPVYVLFGWLSDRIGRLKIILAGLVIAALTYFPLFAALTHYVNPDLEAFAGRMPIVLTADESTCRIHVLVTAFTKFSTCDRAKDFVTKLGLSFKSENAPGMGDKVALMIGANNIEGFDADQWNGAFLDSGYPNLVRNVDGKIVSKPADLSKVGWVMTELILIVMVSYAAMIYGASAAFMAEMFPTRLRYTSLSLPFHIGAGWFGGMLPRYRIRRRVWRYLCRPLVPYRGRSVDRGPGLPVPARYQGYRYRERIGVEGIVRMPFPRRILLQFVEAAANKNNSLGPNDTRISSRGGFRADLGRLIGAPQRTSDCRSAQLCAPSARCGLLNACRARTFERGGLASGCPATAQGLPSF